MNNPVAANESSNVICPVAGIRVTTNAAISTDAGTEELEKVSNTNKSKDDSTVNNPVAANERSNVICPAADITVITNAARSTDAATTASATMLTMVAAPTTLVLPPRRASYVPQGLRALILKDLQICPDHFSNPSQMQLPLQLTTIMVKR